MSDDFRGGRAAKSLDVTGEFNRYQRDWFRSVQERARAGEPFAVVNADAPQEIFRALDIPFVVTQWFSALCAAKQKSRQYLGHLRALGYPDDREEYTSLSFGSMLDPDPEDAPWGGLPRPTILHAMASGDAMRKLFEAWAAHTGAACLLLERSSSWRVDVEPRWWEHTHDRWADVLEPDRLDLMTGELQGLIRFLEETTGRRWDESRFRRVMELVNEQEQWYLETRDLVARTVPAPVSIVDTMPATMVPQWQRGTTWGRDAAKLLHDEVRARVDAGIPACADERCRLMWLGVGLWFNMGFYRAFEESHGAVFVWSIYLALAADGYIRRLGPDDDPLRALASRFVNIGEELRGPTWSSQWHLREALTHRVDGVVALDRLSYFDRRVFREAGIPVVELNVSNVDPRTWDDDLIRSRVARFIEREAAPVAARRRA